MSQRFMIGTAYWRTWQTHFGGKQHVSVTCPACGQEHELDHEITPSGDINPSLDCPNPKCDFHVLSRLQGWQP